jgi:hypothetical protein
LTKVNGLNENKKTLALAPLPVAKAINLVLYSVRHLELTAKDNSGTMPDTPVCFYAKAKTSLLHFHDNSNTSGQQ